MKTRKQENKKALKHKSMLILVNKNDEQIGTETKEKCHQGRGLLHRAFAAFIFNKDGELLIQKRSKLKPLWPLYWDNSCSSHPRDGEGIEESGERRLQEELGFTCPLKAITKMRYQLFYKNLGAENEICYILLGSYDGPIRPNPKEIADFKWLGLQELRADMAKNPDKYTPWFKMGIERLPAKLLGVV